MLARSLERDGSGLVRREPSSGPPSPGCVMPQPGLAGRALLGLVALAFAALVAAPAWAQDNNAATGRPTISGLEKRGAKVTASTSGISDIDGLTRANNGEAGYAYGYQWVRVEGGDETDIEGATSRSYTLAAADVGKRVRVRVSFQDDNGVAEARTSSRFPGSGSITVSGPRLNRSVANRFQFWNRDSAIGLLSGQGTQVHVPSVSQGFTTGSNVTAYRLEAVQIAIDLIDPSTRMTVHLHEDNDGLPGSRILRLDPVGSLRDGTMQFRPRRLQGEYPLLAPDTYYHIRFDREWGGAYLEVAGTNDVAMNGGFGLAERSFSYILRSTYNESIAGHWGHIDYTLIPGLYKAARGEYGQSLRVLDSDLGVPVVVHPGFDVTYGWNRMSRQLRMRLIGTAITSEAPVFNLPPKPVSAAVVPVGNLLDIVFDNVPDDRAGRIPLPEHFTVKVDGAEVTVSAVEVSGADKRVRLRLAVTVKDDERVTVSYRHQSGDNTATLQSPAGVDAPGFANYRVTNGSTVPSLRPAPVSATVPEAGTRVDIVFSHALDDTAGRTPAPERFSVTADGMDVAVSAVGVSGSDKRVRLTVSPAIKTLQAVAVSYRDPSAEDDAAALQSSVGADARSFTGFAAANASTLPDPAPKPVSATVPPAGDRVDIVFNHALDDSAARIPARSRFTVTAEGQRVPIDAIDISRSDMRVRLMLADAVYGGRPVTVSYRDPSPGDDTVALQSPAGADAPSFAGYPAANDSTVADPAPRPTSATVPARGYVIEMAFSQVLDDGAGRTPGASQFSATVNGTNRALRSVRVSGNRVRVELPVLVEAGDTVTVSYEDLSAGDDTIAVQAAGVDAPSFTDYPVTVVPGGGPVLVSAVTDSLTGFVFLLFDREIDGRFSRLPPISAFSVVDSDGTPDIETIIRGDAGDALALQLLNAVQQRSAIALEIPDIAGSGVTVTYTDPTDEDDTRAIQTPGGVDAATFTVSAPNRVDSSESSQEAEAAPLTATFGDLPARHGGEAFTLELAFSEPVAVSAEQLASALSVSNGAVTQAAQVDAQSTRDWLVTVTPAGSDTVTVALVPKQSCEEEGAVCTADGRGLADEAEAEVPGRAPTRVVSAAVTSGPGANGVWDEGETVNAEVRFSRPVGVHGPPGAGPVLDVLLDGTAYEAAYTGGSGTDTFSFRYTVTAAAAGAASAGVASNGLAANGVILGDDEGQEAELGFEAEADAAPPPTRLTVSRRLAENAAPGTAVGPPVVASDPDGDPLTYSLHGEDAGAFAIDAATGQLRAKAGVFYDYELKPAYNVVVVADDGNGNTGSIGVRIELSDVEEELTASFEEAPATHGLAPFALRLRFSEPVDVDRETLRDGLLQVTNGRATQARRLDEDRGLEALTGQSLSALWELTVEPSPTGGDVTVAVPAKDCAAADYAACTRDGRPLSDGARVTVSQGTLPALTAQSSGAPATHDRAAFELQVEFSWRVTATPEAMRTQVLEVTNGEVVEAFRVGDEGTTYGFRILPWSNGGVTVVLPATGDCAAGGAVCTADGRMLLQGIDWQIEPEDPDAVDETAPELVQAEANAMSLVLLYDEGLDADSAPDADAFTVTVAGEPRNLAASGPVAVNGRRVTLALASAAAFGQTVSVGYTAPEEHPLQDMSGNRAASGTAEAVVPEVKLTVRFEEGGLPEEHDGVSPLVFRIAFSEQPSSGFNGQWLSTTLRGYALSVRLGGSHIPTYEAEKLDAPGRQRWKITVRHTASLADKAYEDFTISLGPTRDCADKDAVCTKDGRKLSNRITAVVRGPSAMSVAGAEASEGAEGATLDFAVTLGRALRQAVTVAYATSDGTAVDGEDYTGRSGTLTFEAGETEKTVSVPVLDDAGAEGAETVVLTLSDVSGGNARLVGESATGTIEDDEGLQLLTAEFWDPPAHHTGEAFTFELEFSEAVAVSAEALRDHAFTVTGGAVTAAEQVSPASSRSWVITVSPASATEAVTVALVPKASCDDEGAICTEDGRGLEAEVEAEVPGREPTQVVSATVTSGPGENGTWDTGETVVVEVRFSREVSLSGPPNVKPAIGITLDGTRRDAGYESGSGSDTLRFEYEVAAAEDGAARARVVANSLNLNGVVIGDAEGYEAELGFSVAPELSVADAGGTEGTDAAIAFTVTLAPAAAGQVTVNYATADGTATAPADYTSTSSMLTFEPGQTSKTVEVPIVDDGDDDNGETFTLTLSDPSGAVLADAEATGTIRNTVAEAAPLRAEFRNLPTGGHGGAPFTLQLRFSEEFSLSYKTLQNHALGVTNGTLTGVSRVTQGEDRAWNVTVTPTGGGAVTVALAKTTDCGATGAICTADERMLTAVSATVPETAAPPPPTPFKVSADLPAEHDGTSEIVFEVSFNKEPHADYSYKTLRGKTLRIRQGGASLTPKVRRLNKPHNDRWEVKVTPGSKEDLTVSIGPFTTCSDEGAVCTAADEVLSNKVEETIEGPPGLSVADARVHESVADAALEFAVTLSRAAAATVTVAYATSDGPGDNGATAGHDYEPKSGTLTFLAGETSKTVSVPVYADDHDEGEETLILTLSSPTGGAWLKDATAIGTIENTGPMPRAWLARFGRTVAEQVIDAVEGRFSAQRRPGVEMRLAGQAVGPGSGSGAGAPDDEDARAAEEEARLRLAAMTNWLRGEPGGRNGSRSGAGSGDGERSGGEWRSVLPRELLTGTSFALTGEAGGAGSGTVSLWGRGAVSRFDGREGELTLSGEVTSAMLGSDWMGGPGSGSGAGAWTVGLLVSHSRGEGSYRGADAGTVSSTLTGLYPYGRYMVNERLSVWGVAGYGEGTLTLTPDGQTAVETDMDLKMGAAGVRGVAVEAPAEGGVEVAITSDAMAVRTASEKTAGLAGAEAEVTRLRLGLEGSWRGLEAGGGELVPRLEVGVRHDGGDAETGFGLDVGGGLSWSHPASGLSAELSGRGLLTHESRGFRDRGLSGSFGWEPGRGSGRGPKVTLTQTVGASASGGMDALLRRKTLAGLADDDNGGDDPANRRLELRLGYGFAAFGDRFTSTPELGLELGQGQREVSLGWRLNLARSGPVSMELGLTATRREAANDDGVEPVHALTLHGSMRW